MGVMEMRCSCVKFEKIIKTKTYAFSNGTIVNSTYRN